MHAGQKNETLPLKMDPNVTSIAQNNFLTCLKSTSILFLTHLSKRCGIHPPCASNTVYYLPYKSGLNQIHP